MGSLLATGANVGDYSFAAVRKLWWEKYGCRFAGDPASFERLFDGVSFGHPDEVVKNVQVLHDPLARTVTVIIETARFGILDPLVLEPRWRSLLRLNSIGLSRPVPHFVSDENAVALSQWMQRTTVACVDFIHSDWGDGETGKRRMQCLADLMVVFCHVLPGAMFQALVVWVLYDANLAYDWRCFRDFGLAFYSDSASAETLALPAPAGAQDSDSKQAQKPDFVLISSALRLRRDTGHSDQCRDLFNNLTRLRFVEEFGRAVETRIPADAARSECKMFWRYLTEKQRSQSTAIRPFWETPERWLRLFEIAPICFATDKNYTIHSKTYDTFYSKSVCRDLIDPGASDGGDGDGEKKTPFCWAIMCRKEHAEEQEAEAEAEAEAAAASTPSSDSYPVYVACHVPSDAIKKAAHDHGGLTKYLPAEEAESEADQGGRAKKRKRTADMVSAGAAEQGKKHQKSTKRTKLN